MRLTALALVLALAACSSEPAENDSAGVDVAAPTPTPAVAAKAGEEPADKTTPIAQQSYDFTGAWAAAKEQCGAGGQWSFTRETAESEAAKCTIAAIRNETGVGATLDLSCPGGKERLELLTAPEGGMIVQRYVNDVMTGPQQRLVRCEG